MLLDLTLDEATELVGRGPRNAPVLMRALRRDFVPMKLKRGEIQPARIPSPALVKLKDRRRNVWHWVVRYADLWFDPWGTRPVRRWSIGDWKVTGFVPLVRRRRLSA
jgi:hypothetical protein